MTVIIAPDQELAELQLAVGAAWSAYRDRLRGLDGAEYERAEAEAWEALHTVLGRVESRRRELTAGSA